MSEPKKRGRPKKLKQGYLPTMEPPSISVIDKLGLEVKELETERMRLGKEEESKRELLKAKMREHGLTHYEFDVWNVDLVAGEVKVKVRKKTPADNVTDLQRKREREDA
jgi:hypothetical protein